jgi:SHS family lactate transporter-like MFS transporter
MEMAPTKWRGMLSGILQNGYAVGYLLSAVAARTVLPTFGPNGWRVMFWLGGLPALLAFYIRFKVPESEAWKQHRVGSSREVLRVVAGHWKLFLYLVVLMTFMMFLSHGTQDLYPDFLKSVHGVRPETVAYIAMFYNVGALLGGIFFGQLSETVGRRRSMHCALGLGLAVIPLWAFGSSIPILVLGSFLMQAGVQGAWGIIPAHLNELAPDAARGLMPGLAYQLGILFASPTNNIEYALRNRFGYQWALAGFEIVTMCSIALLLAFGHERRGRSFVREIELVAE